MENQIIADIVGSWDPESEEKGGELSRGWVGTASLQNAVQVLRLGCPVVFVLSLITRVDLVEAAMPVRRS